MPTILDIAEAAASGPSDGTEERTAEEQHCQEKRPHGARLVARDQNDTTEAEDEKREDGQAEFS